MNRYRENIKVCLCMIVRNESHCITKCFDSLLNVVDAIAIVDTGSTDNTIQTIENYLSEKKIHGSVISKRWKHFAISRNDSLEHANSVIRKYYNIETDGPLNREEYDLISKVNWKILITDADNIFLDNTEQCFTEKMALSGKYRCSDFKDQISGFDCCMIPMRSGRDIYYTHMGIVNYTATGARSYRYYCPIHEYIDTKNWSPRIGTISNIHCYSGRHGGRSNTRVKADRDAAALIEAIKECRIDEKDMDRCLYYLGQSYKDAGQYDAGHKYFLARGEMETGFYEERYYSYIQAAIILPYTSFVKYMTKDAIELLRLEYWYKAHEICPYRREALYEIMCYCDSKKMFKRAHESVISWVDNNDINSHSLFVDGSLYGWKFDEKLALICYYAGKYNDFKKYLERAIADPKIDENLRKRLMEHRQFYKLHNL